MLHENQATERELADMMGILRWADAPFTDEGP
jgi:hypothetical protein